MLYSHQSKIHHQNGRKAFPAARSDHRVELLNKIYKLVLLGADPGGHCIVSLTVGYQRSITSKDPSLKSHIIGHSPFQSDVDDWDYELSNPAGTLLDVNRQMSQKPRA